MSAILLGADIAADAASRRFLRPTLSNSTGVTNLESWRNAAPGANNTFFVRLCGIGLAARPGVVFTSSNHTPFEFPDGRIELYDAEKATVNNAVKYADHALGEFFAKARASDYWENTVFLVVANHNSRVYGAELVPVKRFHIPALVLGGSIEPAVFETVASQIDLAPTSLSLINVGAEHPMIGHDLTQPDAGSRVNRLITLENIDAALSQRDLARSTWSSTAYDEALYRLPQDSRLALRPF